MAAVLLFAMLKLPNRYDPTTGKLNRAYRKWSSMIQRCTNPKHLAYRYYGGAGVTVAESWRSFDAFLADMGHPPAGMWLDRINNAQGYGPGNCRWVTSKQSAANRKPRGKVEGSLKDLARKAGLPYSVVYQRVKWSWPLEEALSRPIMLKGERRR